MPVSLFVLRLETENKNCQVCFRGDKTAVFSQSTFLQTIFLRKKKFTSENLRPFHYPEDHGGVKPKEFSAYVGPKSKISEKWTAFEVVWGHVPSAKLSQSAKFGRQGLTASIMFLFF